MTAHDHSTRVPGCFRCDLTGDEMGMTDNETVERLAREAFERFVESFNGDEAGDIDHVGAINGDTGFAMRGGNDVWAVMLKATQALLPAICELQAKVLGEAAQELDEIQSLTNEELDKVRRDPALWLYNRAATYRSPQATTKESE